MVEALVLPDEVYSDAVDIYLGARQIQVRYMLGHTGGDSVVAVPDADVVFAGDLIWQKHLPNLIDATTGEWVKTSGEVAGGPSFRQRLSPAMAMLRLQPMSTIFMTIWSRCEKR